MLPEALTTQVAMEPAETWWAVVVSLLVLLGLLSCYFLVLSLHRRWIRKRYGFDDPVDLGPNGLEEPATRARVEEERPRTGPATT